MHYFSASSTSEILQKVSLKENKVVGTKLFYMHLESMLACFKDCLKWAKAHCFPEAGDERPQC